MNIENKLRHDMQADVNTMFVRKGADKVATLAGRRTARKQAAVRVTAVVAVALLGFISFKVLNNSDKTDLNDTIDNSVVAQTPELINYSWDFADAAPVNAVVSETSLEGESSESSQERYTIIGKDGDTIFGVKGVKTNNEADSDLDKFRFASQGYHLVAESADGVAWTELFRVEYGTQDNFSQNQFVYHDGFLYRSFTDGKTAQIFKSSDKGTTWTQETVTLEAPSVDGLQAKEKLFIHITDLYVNQNSILFTSRRRYEPDLAEIEATLDPDAMSSTARSNGVHYCTREAGESETVAIRACQSRGFATWEELGFETEPELEKFSVMEGFVKVNGVDGWERVDIPSLDITAVDQGYFAQISPEEDALEEESAEPPGDISQRYSSRFGKEWKLVGEGPAIDLTSYREMLVGDIGQTLVVSDDNGATWSRVDLTALVKNHLAEFDPADYYISIRADVGSAGIGLGLFVVSYDEQVEGGNSPYENLILATSTDGAKTWDTIELENSSNPQVIVADSYITFRAMEFDDSGTRTDRTVIVKP